MKITRKIRRIIRIGINSIVVYKSQNVRYYNQYSLKYYFKKYGQERMGPVACGPFCCAIVASSLLDKQITPVETAKWAYDNGYYEYKHGSLHSLIPSFCEKMGLECIDVGYEIDKMEALLKREASMAILLCKQGAFSAGRHFISVAIKNGCFKVYNSCNVLDCYRSFDKEQLLQALATENVYIGPIWCISKKVQES